MERKIGEIFEYNGEWFQCLKGISCKECDFSSNNITCDIHGAIACTRKGRSDNTSVVFKKLEKVGEPYMTHDLSRNKDVVVQDYKLHNQHACYNGQEEMLIFGINGRVGTVTIKSKEPIRSLNCENSVEIEIKQNKEDIEGKKKQTSLDLTKGIYEKFKGKTVQCLVNNKDGDLVNGYGIVCGYTNKYLIIGFTNGYEGCIKSFTDNVFLENRDFLSYRFWNISHVDDKPFIKPFNLESARSGKPVCTRDGRKARILCYDLKGAEYPIVAAVETRDRFAEIIFGYDKNGRFDHDIENNNDLMMLQEKKSGWINVYKRLVYRTKEEAQSNINPDNEVIDTIKISWEE